MSDKKVVMVTGAAGGIGRAVLNLFLPDYVVIACEASNQLIANLQQEQWGEHAANLVFLEMDVTSSAMIEAALLAVTKSYGGVDILINAAGITIDKPMKKLTDKDWFDVLNVNLTGTFYTCRAVAPIMAARGGGSIVNVSSIVGIDGNACQANYAASKAGVIGLTKSLAKELAPKNIRVNAVAPGFINTSMTAKVPPEILKSYIDRTPLKRQGKPIEVAKAIKYLVADADYSTGDIIVVDGGLTIGV